MALALSSALGAHVARSQAPRPTAVSALGSVHEQADGAPQTPDWKVWASIARLEGTIRAPEHLPPGNVRGGALAVWATYRHLALSAYSMGMPESTDGGLGVGEQGVLGGAHLALGRRTDFVVALGAGRSGGTGYLVRANGEAMFDAAAQLNVNYRFVGLELEARTGVGPTRRYVATGVGLAFGWFR